MPKKIKLDIPQPEVFPCDSSRSFFRFIDEHWRDQNSKAVMHRICAMMRLMGAKSVIIEQLSLDAAVSKNLSLEVAAIQTRLGRGRSEIKARRFTFVDRNVPLEQVTDLPDNVFLGYLDVVDVSMGATNTLSYVFQSVVREFGPGESRMSFTDVNRLPWRHYLHVQNEFQAELLGGKRTYHLPGTFFCQQNNITSMCAHACTAMLINNVQGATELITCEQINQLLGINHRNRMQEVPEHLGDNTRATHEGLYPKEIMRVLRERGFDPFEQEFQPPGKRIPYREFIYNFIESGYPALLTFHIKGSEGTPRAHVVAVVGHSLNRHSWFPTAYVSYADYLRKDRPFISSLTWVDEFIVHDDNFGMQLYLPAHSFRPDEYPDPGASFMPDSAIGIFPNRLSVRLRGHIAEKLAWDALSALFEGEGVERDELALNYYVAHLWPHVTGKDRVARTAVLRTLLVPTEKYLENLKLKDNLGDQYSQIEIEQVRQILADRKAVWLSEVTEPDLYVANQSKVLDVLVDPELEGVDVRAALEGKKQAVLLIRTPHRFVNVTPEEGKLTFGARKIKGIRGHLPLLRTAT